MSDNSACLELTDSVSGDVVAANEAPGASCPVKQQESCPTAALAPHIRVGLPWTPKIVALPVLDVMLRSGKYLKVLGAVVQLVAVAVVDNLAATQLPSEHLGRHESMLIDVAARVGHWMIRLLHEYIAARRDRSAALPSVIFGTRLSTRHAFSVANRLGLR